MFSVHQTRWSDSSTGGRSLQYISVLFVTFNSGDVLAATLLAVRELLPNAEIIVIDNGSTDDTLGIARTVVPDVHVVHGHGNVGFGAAMNIGARVAHGNLLILLNPDALPTRVDHSFLHQLSEQDDVGLQACRIEDGRGFEGHLVFRQWGWRRELYWIFMQAILKPREIRIVRPRVQNLALADWASGAALIVAKNEFVELGGFDENFFLYCEDRDLSRRYLASGLPIGATDALTVLHAGGGSSPSDPAVQITWSCLAHIQYAAKWNDEEAAQRAARLALRFFGTIDSFAQLGTRSPFLGGERYERWSAKVHQIRTGLLRAGEAPGKVTGHYLDARNSLAHAVVRSKRGSSR